MREPDDSRPIHDERSRQLSSVSLAEAALMLLSDLVPEPREPHLGTGDLIEGAAAQPVRAVRGAVRARDAFEPHTAIRAERGGLPGATEADQRHGGAGLLEPFSVVTQLRDVRAAERSPEMAEEREDRRPLSPERGQRDVAAAAVEHLGIRRPPAHLDRS